MNVNSVGKANLECQSVERPIAPASIRNHVGLRGIAAVLPPRTHDLEDLQRSGLLVSDLPALKELGFEKVHVCGPEHNAGWLALESARLAMTQAEVEPAEIDVLIWASALSETHVQERWPSAANANRRTVGPVPLSGELAAGRTSSR